jgi:hypothetical protein
VNVTVVVAETGEVVASVQAHASDFSMERLGADEPVAFPTLIPNAGQSVHEITVPDDVQTDDAQEFHSRLAGHLPR